jgi:uncharacterized protein (DUF433 family)/predicted nuclease of predicted toxin-antitoxin system
MTRTDLLQRITADPEIFQGKPIIRGMRISVELILSLLAQGESAEAILLDYPDLEREDLPGLRSRRDRQRHARVDPGRGSVRFLIDRCAGRRLADWLRHTGHDVVESRDLGKDPGDRALLERAHQDERILITIDTDFGTLIFRENQPHRGLIRLPDVPATNRIQLVRHILKRHSQDLAAGAVITARGPRLRISFPPRRSTEG